jgi:glycerol-3-phosphate O-acyltransferase
VSARHATGLTSRPPRESVVSALAARSEKRWATLPDATLFSLLEDALFHERARVEKQGDETGLVSACLDDLARGLVADDRELATSAGLNLVRAWAEEIHGRFSPRAHRLATTIMPRILMRLISGREGRFVGRRLQQDPRLRIGGDLELIRDLANEGTIILVPTHISNLDSPLIGWALHQAGLPPFVYGAGLNLFSNKVMGWWMSRLGAYTVDRTKRAAAYKAVLKDYSVWCLRTRHHSLFFPGGTRARSGSVESRLKKGLLGTGLEAWQEMVEEEESARDVYVVPLTMTFQMVLEASTLIEDHLAESGKQRYIISDDEFAEPQTIANFARRILALDSAVVMEFGAPLDLLGAPVPATRGERIEASKRRRGYICGADGRVQRDTQRDRVYTDRLADRICAAYRCGSRFMATHVAAAAAWGALVESAGSEDPFRVLRIPLEGRRIKDAELVKRINDLMDRLREGESAGLWQTELPSTAYGVLETALDRFDRYHRTRALKREGNAIVVEDPKLCFYYRNRLDYVEQA